MWLDTAIRREATAEVAGGLAMQALRARGVEVPAEPTWENLHELLRKCDARWRATGSTGLQNTKPPDGPQWTARLAHHLQTPEGTPLRNDTFDLVTN